MNELKYKDYTIQTYWSEESWGWFYKICCPNSELELRDYLGSKLEFEAIDAAKFRIDQEIAKLNSDRGEV